MSNPFPKPTMPSAVGIAAAIALASAMAPPASAQPSKPHAHGRAHVHGAARLGVAIDGRQVTLSLEAPLDGLVGFERKPRNDAERQAVDALRARMAAPGDLFRFDAAAGCALTASEASSPVFSGGADARQDAHADLEATFRYACAEPARLKALEVGLFAAYPRLNRIAIEIAGPGGQSKRELKRPATSVPLPGR